MNQKMSHLAAACLSILLLMAHAAAETVEYDLTIGYKWVNFTGKRIQAMAINGQIPGPTLTMKEGDSLLIRVHNEMDVETSIHWHGILLPNREDGVPYLTTPPILPGKTYVYRFPVIQSGTYWYHSHTHLQEQRGVYGSIVIHPKKERIASAREYVLVLSDWTDENPDRVLRTLKRGSEYYSLKKGTIQSLSGAIQAKALKEMFQRWLDRMPPMDISDVAYDQFLVNGAQEIRLEAEPGDTVRLRIINASASTYFYVQSSTGSMRVVSADGLEVKPVELERMLIAVAETYDVLVTLPPSPGSFEFRATAQDGTGFASAFLGAGPQKFAPDVPKPNLYKLHAGGAHGHTAMPQEPQKNQEHQHHEEHQKPQQHQEHAQPVMKMEMEMSQERPLAPYGSLRSLQKTLLEQGQPWRTITLQVTGDMVRYVWSFNGKTLKESDRILIRHGENVRIVFVNKTMMHHPIHLHGHFFRVLNGQGDYAPLKHTVDIPPLGEQAIEFFANEEKDWFLHCHILYHMESGMARIVHYQGTRPDPDVEEARTLPSNPLRKDPWFVWGEAAVLSQMNEGRVVAAGTRNTLLTRWEAGWQKGDEYEVDAVYDYYFNRFFTAFVGVHAQDNRARGIIGFNYLLPLLIESRFWINTRGDVRLELDKEIQLTSRLGILGAVEYDTRDLWEWKLAASWTLSRYLWLRSQYHSDFGLGLGLEIRY